MCYHTEEWWKIWRGIDLSSQNWHNEFDEFWLEHLKVSKTYTLMGCFWPKYMMFELKKCREVIFHGTGKWCKIWRKTDLRFRKWFEEFGRFSPEHWKISKLGRWCDPFIQIREYIGWKFPGELCVMIMNNDAKFEKWLNCQFKIDMSNLTNLIPALKNYKS